jgi:hypothetical protein
MSMSICVFTYCESFDYLNYSDFHEGCPLRTLAPWEISFQSKLNFRKMILFDRKHWDTWITNFVLFVEGEEKRREINIFLTKKLIFYLHPLHRLRYHFWSYCVSVASFIFVLFLKFSNCAFLFSFILSLFQFFLWPPWSRTFSPTLWVDCFGCVRLWEEHNSQSLHQNYCEPNNRRLIW